jgi:hypothetical protein
MNVTYQTSINTIKAYPSYESTITNTTLTNVVYQVNWKMKGTDADSGIFAFGFGTTTIPFDSTITFTEFINLEESTVIGWVTTYTDPKTITNVQNDIIHYINTELGQVDRIPPWIPFDESGKPLH